VEDRISGLKDNRYQRKKQKNAYTKDLKAVKGLCMNSVFPLKEQTCELWALRNRCKPKAYTIHS
jgi:hypothetical protein